MALLYENHKYDGLVSVIWDGFYVFFVSHECQSLIFFPPMSPTFSAYDEEVSEKITYHVAIFACSYYSDLFWPVFCPLTFRSNDVDLKQFVTILTR